MPGSTPPRAEVAMVVGTRPEAIKLAPLVEAALARADLHAIH